MSEFVPARLARVYGLRQIGVPRHNFSYAEAKRKFAQFEGTLRWQMLDGSKIAAFSACQVKEK